MINFLLLVNKLGQTRIAQYYVDLPLKERRTLESELVRKCLSRDDSKCSIIIHQNYKIIYRRYVSLYFIIGVDLNEEVF
jgi:AP-4 complex subunit sigma-1